MLLDDALTSMLMDDTFTSILVHGVTTSTRVGNCVQEMYVSTNPLVSQPFSLKDHRKPLRQTK